MNYTPKHNKIGLLTQKQDIKKLDLKSNKTDLKYAKNLYTEEKLTNYSYYFTPIPKYPFMHTGNSKFAKITDEVEKKPFDFIPPEFR